MFISWSSGLSKVKWGPLLSFLPWRKWGFRRNRWAESLEWHLTPWWTWALAICTSQRAIKFLWGTCKIHCSPIHRLTKQAACRYCWTSTLGGQSSKLSWIWPLTTWSKAQVCLQWEGAWTGDFQRSPVEVILWF